MPNLAEQWSTLGLAFYSAESITPASPEEAMIDLICSGEFPEDKKMMSLLLLWLKNYSKVVHIERLKNFCEKLGAYELATLGGIATKCFGDGDHRWKTIINFVKAKNTGNPRFEKGDSENYIKIKSLDADFAEFGIQIGMIKLESEKKLIPRQILVKKNTWIKNRILFGANVRADIATIRELSLATTAYAAAQIAHCSNNAAYRNWADLDEAGWFPSVKPVND